MSAYTHCPSGAVILPEEPDEPDEFDEDARDWPFEKDEESEPSTTAQGLPVHGRQDKEALTSRRRSKLSLSTFLCARRNRTSWWDR